MSLKEVSQVVDALQSALTPTSTSNSTSTRHEKTFPKVSTPKRRRLPQTPNSGVKFSQSPRVEGVRERCATSVPELVSYTHPPRLPLFSGLNDSKDATYRQWSYEVRALYRDKLYSDSVLLQAIRRSLKGPAAETLYNLGEIVDVNDILTKFDHVYGDVLSSGIILQQFYASNQTKAESVAAWACRLEDMVSKLTLKKPPAVSEDGAKSMLRLKFYNGLYSSSVRQLLRHRYDSGATFDELLVEARTIELEEQGRSPLTCKVQQSSSEAEDKIDKLLEVVHSLKERMSVLESQLSTQSRQNSSQPRRFQQVRFTGRCWHCGNQGHRQINCPSQNHLNENQPVEQGNRQALSRNAQNQ
ncbi:uncharacterized protein LOC106177286 [Lingula anatina]|uniref:Uncharacterized protein LOC106177286 n=1 Tax=Lingula anatina TaxID=7574 RepID=A0A1S3JZL9_LINAN|nr:uncharacterized protein LOC106177286 [Lingula anatina]|eukprot:XP_013415476.1 uncharacterized protein LOC106177286 [Lingula anatina]